MRERLEQKNRNGQRAGLAKKGERLIYAGDCMCHQSSNWCYCKGWGYVEYDLTLMVGLEMMGSSGWMLGIYGSIATVAEVGGQEVGAEEGKEVSFL